MKNLNELGVLIKKLLVQRFYLIWITRKLNIRRQNVNYCVNNHIKMKQNRRNKLEDKYIPKIKSLAKIKQQDCW